MADILWSQLLGIEADAVTTIDLEIEQSGSDPAGVEVCRHKSRRADLCNDAVVADDVDQLASPVITRPQAHHDFLPATSLLGAVLLVRSVLLLEDTNKLGHEDAD